VIGKPMWQASRDELELDLAVNTQVETQLRREADFIMIVERLMYKKFGSRVRLEALPGDVWSEADSAWRAVEGSDPPISPDDELEL
jgi:hypothetical protein